MKTINLVTLILLIVGGLNWGLFGFANVDLVASLFGGPNTLLAKAVYIIVGLCAAYQLWPFTRALQTGEIVAEAGGRPLR